MLFGEQFCLFCSDLQINWCFFNIVLGDNQLIDLKTYYGSSFQSDSALSSPIMMTEDKNEIKNTLFGSSKGSADIEREVSTNKL